MLVSGIIGQVTVWSNSLCELFAWRYVCGTTKKQTVGRYFLNFLASLTLTSGYFGVCGAIVTELDVELQNVNSTATSSALVIS